MNNFFRRRHRYKYFGMMLLSAFFIISCSALAPLRPEQTQLISSKQFGTTNLEQARRADAFIDSIGVNVHLGYTDTAYKNYDSIVKPKLKELGVRHIRDGFLVNRPDVYKKLNDLANFGIHSTLIAGIDWVTPQEALAIAKQVDNSLEVVEGPNEYDLKVKDAKQWVPKMLDYMEQLHHTFKNNPATSQLPLAAPSFVKPNSSQLVGDLSQWVDYGNMHPYNYPNKPGTPNLDREITIRSLPSQGKPILATETGYHTGNLNSDRPISEKAQSKYLPRLFLEYFNREIHRTFSYEFIDQHVAPDDREANFGIVRNDGSPKPAFTALKNTIALLKDSEANFEPERLDYTLSGSTKDLHHTLLQKSNGTFYLILWQEVPSFQPDKHLDSIVPERQVTLNLNTQIDRAAIYRPLDSVSPLKEYTNPKQLKLSIPDHPLIVELAPVTQTISLAQQLSPSSQTSDRSNFDTFEDRAKALIEYHATHEPNRPKSDGTGYAKSGIYTAMARYAAGDIQGGNAMTEYIYKHPHGAAMFLVMGGMDLHLRYKKYMPPKLQKAARFFITNHTDYTGGSTENHGIMFAAGGYLAAQEWPDWDRADRVREQTKQHIYKFIDNMSRHGIVEHDSPTYHVFFVNSLLSLYDHAKDPEMRQKAQIGLELLLTSMAPEWLDGHWATSTLRTSAFSHDGRQGSLSGTLGWLYWGGSVMPPRKDGCAIMSAVSNYRIPEVLEKIGQNRSHPYVHRETQGMNFNDDYKYRKYTYMDRQYAMFSQFDGNGWLAWHDRMQRMGVVWLSPAPGATLVIKHPVKGIKGDTKDGQVLQHERALIGVYKDSITGYLPNNTSIVEQFEDSGWLFIHGGTALIGVKIIKGFSWSGTEEVKGISFKKIYSDASKNGVIIQTAPVEDFPGSSAKEVLKSFANAVKSKTKVDSSGINKGRPKLKYTSLSGDVLEMEFSRERKINGVAIDYNSWPLFENPWMESEAGRSLTVNYDGTVRKYDFKNWKIRESSQN